MTTMTDRHNMSDRQRQFRAEYMEGVRAGYSGPLHIGVIYVVGLTMIAWCLSRPVVRSTCCWNAVAQIIRWY